MTVSVLIMVVGIYFFKFPNNVQRFVFRGIRYSLADSPFASLSTILAATIGIGNIVGVSTAVALGGPGAILWC